jgi:2-polyprenyl-3-methyl-5-hydroxy-6-metoxy-1,4-benzoquinol methylase
MTEFDPRQYWERRLDEEYTLDGVGYSGFGERFNGWMYRVRRHVFLRSARRFLGDRGRRRVFDVGSGTGFYVDRWHELGVAAVTGSDLTETAVSRLRQTYASDAFVQLDIGADDGATDIGPFDAISAVDVLFHIVDDRRFVRAFQNMHGLLVPGGVLLFSDNFLRSGSARVEHQVSRSREQIEEAVNAAGLEILERRPMFVLLNTPIDTTSRFLRLWWRVLENVAARSARIAGLVAAIVYPLELALVSRLPEGPSTELMVCRRPAGAGPAR